MHEQEQKMRGTDLLRAFKTNGYSPCVTTRQQTVVTKNSCLSMRPSLQNGGDTATTVCFENEELLGGLFCLEDEAMGIKQTSWGAMGRYLSPRWVTSAAPLPPLLLHRRQSRIGAFLSCSLVSAEREKAGAVFGV